MVAAAATAVAVFAIRPRPAHHVISSLTIWNRVLDEAREQSFWDRVRWAVSLALTALIAVAIAAALAKPAPRTDARSAGRALLVLDSSWSMRARTPSGATRWERAIQAARAMADTSDAREIAIATTAEGVVEGPTADLALIHSALSRLEPSGGPDGSWPAVAGAGDVHFFTDGALARATPPDVVVHSVFAPASNVALTAFDVEPAGGDGSSAEVFLAVGNFAPKAQTVHLTVMRGASVVLNRSVAIRAEESDREVVAVPSAGDARFQAHITAADNALELDDDAVAWLWTAQPLRVGVVGVSSPVVALLAQDTTVRASTVTPADYARANADVWIFDRWLPPEAPSRPALIIDPPDSPWLSRRGAAAAHPILDGVDTGMVRIDHTPLVSVEDSASARYVVLGFSMLDANFASTPAFPILVGNAIDWLGRPERNAHRQPGLVSLPAATRRVVAPNGQSLSLLRFDDRVTTTLPAPGLYLAEGLGGQSVVSVGLRDPGRSNLLVSTVVPDRSVQPPSRGEGRPWWIYMAYAALVLVSIEWVTWQRRVTI